MVPWSRIHILGRYTYYMSAAQAERRVARSLSKIAMQLTPSPAKIRLLDPGQRRRVRALAPLSDTNRLVLDPSRACAVPGPIGAGALLTNCLPTADSRWRRWCGAPPRRVDARLGRGQRWSR